MNLPRPAGPLLDAAAKLLIRTGPDAVAVHKATQERAFKGEKRDDEWEGHDDAGRLTLRFSGGVMSHAARREAKADPDVHVGGVD